jgi:hypothetical protein
MTHCWEGIGPLRPPEGPLRPPEAP